MILIVNPNSLVVLVLVRSDGSGAACPHHISLRDVIYYLSESYKKVERIPTSMACCSDVVLLVHQTDSF